MSSKIAFSDVLDVAEQLAPEDQAELVAVLSRRLAERGRQRIVETVAQARSDFAAGQCQPMSADEIVNEAQQ